jgi:ABC-type branched-subunit amino acid transport system substrate-binding protein
MYMSRRQFIGQACQWGATAALPWWALSSRAAEEVGASKTITIGSSLALTGPLGAGGTEHLAGVRAAFWAANQAGGVAGRELKLDARDDGYVPARTVDNVRKLLDGGNCVALMSCLGTANNTAILPLVEQQGVPLVGPISGAGSLRQPGLQHVFHIRAGYTDEVQRVLQQLVSIGIKDIAIIYLDNPFGKEVQKDAEAALVAQGLRAAVSVALAVDGSNAAAAADAALAAKPGAVLLGTAGSGSAAVLQLIRKQASGLPVVGLSVTMLGVDVVKLGAATQGVALTQVFPDPEKGRVAAVRAYQAAMRSANETAMGTSSFEGWVNAQVMIEGLRRAGRELSRDKLRQSLASIRRLDLGDFVVGYSGNAPFQGSRFVDLAVFGANGRRVS